MSLIDTDATKVDLPLEPDQTLRTIVRELTATLHEINGLGPAG